MFLLCFLNHYQGEYTMMKAVKLSALAAVAALATGCASTSDIDNLQAQIDALKPQVTAAASDAASAKAAASEASSRAASAEAAANRAAQYAQETNAKLDRLFAKTVRK
jgi:murein lipoprotein